MVVVQFVTANAFNGNIAVSPFSAQGFYTQNPDINSLYLRIGSERYPQNFEYGHDAGQTLGDGDAYQEYVRCCEPEADGSLPAKALLNPLNRSLNVYVFDNRQNNETMFNRADDATGLDSIELHCKFNQAVTADVVCIVSSFSNNLLSIEPNGKVVIDN